MDTYWNWPGDVNEYQQYTFCSKHNGEAKPVSIYTKHSDTKKVNHHFNYSLIWGYKNRR